MALVLRNSCSNRLLISMLDSLKNQSDRIRQFLSNAAEFMHPKERQLQLYSDLFMCTQKEKAFIAFMGESYTKSHYKTLPSS